MLGDEVFAWLATLPVWQRDLARRLATQVELGDDDYAEALSAVKAQFGGPLADPAPQFRPIARGDLSAAPSDGTTRLTSPTSTPPA